VTAPAFTRLLLASSNSGKLREYHQLAAASGIEIELVPNFRNLPAFDELAPTFAENAAGKALHYSRLVEGIVLADDSGLVVPALGGAPGVHSARYAGPDATDAERIGKLLRAMEGKKGNERRARFVCATAIAARGRALAVVSDLVEGMIGEEARGSNGFGYDPVFQIVDGNRTYAELPAEEKNRSSHRGRSFSKLVAIFSGK
jgi:XTP/dITP diphosphohydrolase